MTKQRTNNKIDLAEIRARLSEAKGQRYWQSLDEIAETEEFQEFLNTEFPHGSSPDMNDPVSRRTFLKLMGASLALAGLTSCSIGPLQPEERIIPYVVPPSENTPGLPLFFASAAIMGGFGKGIVVESHEGRPVKIEGNFRNPGSLGSTDIFTQASILTMYDPDRSTTVLNGGSPSSWDALANALQISGTGGGLRILSETVTSPLLADQMEKFFEKFPSAKWYQYEPVNRSNVYTGARMAFGEYVEPVYQFEKAKVILALDSDFLSSAISGVRYSREFINGRRVRSEDPVLRRLEMNRLYVVESTPTITGTMADHRQPLRASQIEDFARLVAEGVGASVGSGDSVEAAWVDALVKDLQEHSGESLVIAGDQQPPVVHAIAYAINEALGNVGTTVTYTEPVVVEPSDQVASIKELAQEMSSGKVDTLVILGGNPVYNTPADLDFAGSLANVNQSFHISLYVDETSELCTWHGPAAHFLESWGDVRTFDGTVSIVQPLIAPLYGGKTPVEIVEMLLGNKDTKVYDLLRSFWQEQLPDATERDWEFILQNGVVEDTTAKPVEVSVTASSFPKSAKGGGIEVIFRPDPKIWDGSFANNAWLQELPDPITKMTWDNVVLVSPLTAYEYGLDNGHIAQVMFNGTWVQGPVWIMPGHADYSVTLSLGYGRWAAGNVGNGVGFNANEIRTTDTFWFGGGGDLANTGQKYKLASTQLHQSIKVTDPLLQQRMNERIPKLLRTGTLQHYLADPEFIHHEAHGGEGGLPFFYEKFETASGEAWDGSAWAMVIDLNACVGCNACVAACNAENNIPVVGKEQVTRGREMHWIRIDRYYEGELDNPNTFFQPLGCMHCERAPCEPVCPVAATTHSLEGLNEMTYNRCVGTRYCGNNCPYKVRRFNFFNYAENFDAPSLNLMKNPNVTVRTRGVMEKCSYCVQRINAARIVSKRENIPIADGEIVTACEAACPTQAITFGNKNDSFSRVSQLKREPLNYSLLEEVGTVPRTTYLARLRNPNPEIEPVEFEVHQEDGEMHSEGEHSNEEETHSDH